MKRIHFMTAACALMSAAGATQAAPLVFDDRDAFVAAAKPQHLQTFNEEEHGTSFAEQPHSFGNMTFEGDFGYNVLLNYIHDGVAQDPFKPLALDGSPFALGWVAFEKILKISFFEPVLAWGADFRDFGDNGRTSVISFYDVDETLLGEAFLSGFADEEAYFRGFDFAGEVVSFMTFRLEFGDKETSTGFPIFDDAFGMDNIAFTTARGGQPAPVPLPAGMALLGSALGVFGLKRALSKQRGRGDLS